jgi:hypothetical protein
LPPRLVPPEPVVETVFEEPPRLVPPEPAVETVFEKPPTLAPPVAVIVVDFDVPPVPPRAFVLSEAPPSPLFPPSFPPL